MSSLCTELKLRYRCVFKLCINRKMKAIWKEYFVMLRTDIRKLSTT